MIIRYIYPDGRQVFICKNCRTQIDAKELSLFPKLTIYERKMPNQQYIDVLEKYIICPRCKSEIILGEGRMTFKQSFSETMKRINEK